MYSEFEDDPKVQMMPEDMQRRLAMLFCERCKGERRTDAQRAFKLRITLEQLAATKALFLDQGFIDEDWNLVNWNKRQFLSDSSTDRVRKHRAKQAVKQDETLHETVGNVTVTAPDTEADTEQKQKEGSGKKKSRSSKGKPSRAEDERFTPFRESFERYYLRQAGFAAPWDGREASALSKFLKANPTLAHDQWRRILWNRAESPNLAHAVRMSAWIERAPAWLNGTADEWGKPITNGGHDGKSNGNGTHTQRAVASTIDGLQRNLRIYRNGRGEDPAGDRAIVGELADGNQPGSAAGVGAEAQGLRDK